MNFDDLESLIQKGESRTLELKASTGKLRTAFETLCGFLNTEGGTVLVGVKPDKTIVGQQVADKTKQKIAARLGNLEPFSPVNVDYVSIPGNEELQVIVLSVEDGGPEKPFVYDGRPWERVETTTQKMAQEKYERMLMAREKNRSKWESEVAKGYTLDDLDEEEILRTRRLGIENNRMPESAKNDPEQILKRLNLMENGQLLNAAVVLFAKKIGPYYPQLNLKMARFAGNDKSEFIDNQSLKGHAFKLLEEGMMFQRRHLPIAGKIPDNSLVREDDPLYPVKALREALVNAICHRDYRHSGGSISLAIFDDRLEIASFGSLPGDLKAEELKRDHRSVLRNPLIAGAFYMRGLVERWGRGTQDIIRLCVDAGKAEPEFSEEPGPFVQVTFRTRESFQPKTDDIKLDEDEKQIVEYLKKNDHITTQKAEELIGKSYKTAQRKLATLKKKKIIKKQAKSKKDPSGRYVLVVSE
jgi:ATP-dependent DNA helicase RecG